MLMTELFCNFQCTKKLREVEAALAIITEKTRVLQEAYTRVTQVR